MQASEARRTEMDLLTKEAPLSHPFYRHLFRIKIDLSANLRVGVYLRSFLTNGSS